jgi:glycosyltransferase involved in cell wall biosynthesis
MVILHTETLRKWGGQQNRVLLESIGLGKRGHKVVIACRKESVLARKAREAGIRVYEVNFIKRAHLSSVAKLVRIIKGEGVEIVSTHSSVDSWAGGIAAKLTGRCLVRFRHNLYPIGRDPLTRFIYAIPDEIIAVSKTVKEVMMGYGLKKRRIRVITDSVDVGAFTPDVDDLRDEFNISPETAIIGNTSGFTRVKGQKYLLEAFNRIYDKCPCVLLLAGGTTAQDGYLSSVREDLRKYVIFPGNRDDVPRVLKTIDVFVYPSFKEGLGTALLEAMTMGKPVAVSDIPTFRDFIEEGENGICFNSMDSADIANKVLSLMNNRDLQKHIGSNARATALNRFTLNNMLDLTESLYTKALNTW